MSDGSGFHIIENLSKEFHPYAKRMLTSLDVIVDITTEF